jgi:integral membrane protein
MHSFNSLPFDALFRYKLRLFFDNDNTNLHCTYKFFAHPAQPLKRRISLNINALPFYFPRPRRAHASPSWRLAKCLRCAKLVPMASIRTLRRLGLIEGCSFLVLLFIAMPLKYLFGQPMAVTWVGWAHGVLFMAFAFQLAMVFFQHRWSIPRAATAMAAALLPFGPFVLDRRMRDWEAEASAPSPSP